MSKERIKALRTEIATLHNQGKTLYAEMEADPTKRTSENNEKFDRILADGTKKREEVERLEKLEGLSAFGGDGGAEPKVGLKGGGDPEPEGEGAAPTSRAAKSWGQRLVESDQYKRAAANWIEGRMDRVKVGNIQPVLKALSSTSASGGYLYRADRQPEIIDTARQRPFSVIDLIGKRETTLPAVEYVEISSRTNNAAFTDELATGRTHVSAGAGITDEMIAADNGNFGEDFGMKPKGDIAFNLKTAIVKTIPEWIPASRQILSDAPNLRGIVDDELTYMLRVKLEDYIVSANVTGFVGILNASGIGTRVHKTSGARWSADDTVADTIRRMFTDIMLAFYEADAVMVSPEVAEALELEKGADGHYLRVFDPVQQRVWRKRVVESNALNGGNNGTAIAGNFALGATLWDRQDVEVRVGEPGNFFLQNAVAILGELRAAFAVVRPLAFEKATGLLS